jgi:hypothetical protein
MLVTYAIHVLGTWEVKNYRPDSQTTSTVILYNQCAILGTTHTLRPNTGISAISDGIDGTKLGGSFMNFFDGHLVAMVLLALLLGAGIFAIRQQVKRARQ